MQRSSNTWRVTTFGANASLGPQRAESNRFARGTIPRMKGQVQQELGNPVVWFKRENTKGLSEKVSDAFHQQGELPASRTSSVLVGIPAEKLGRGTSIADDIQKVLSVTDDKEPTPDEASGPHALEPDAIFTSAAAPINLAGSEHIVGSNSRSPQKRLVSVDLWTIVFGTLVLSIGAQYLLQGFGLSSL